MCVCVCVCVCVCACVRACVCNPLKKHVVANSALCVVTLGIHQNKFGAETENSGRAWSKTLCNNYLFY